MRFAVGLLSLLAIASIIGTVLKQNEPYPGYLIEFGAFWFEAWRVLGLYDVYHAVWFLLILGFLVLSTTLCIIRHAPGFVREMRSWRERARVVSLRAMHHHVQWSTSGAPAQLHDRAAAILQGLGFRTRRVDREHGVLLVAKKGNWQRLGYFVAHLAIVMICIGGLVDGNLPYQVQSWLGLKREAVGPFRYDAPPVSRLPASNASFRGNVTLAEGEQTGAIFLQSGRGWLLQDLPFTVELKRFYIEHYSTGQPRRFASDIVVTDRETGERTARTIEVNHPLTVRGITIYQASFDDGGSQVDLQVWDDAGGSPLRARSLTDKAVNWSGTPYTLELDRFRLFNIEPGGELPKVDQLTRAMAVKQEKNLRNVGPSITYRLRDAGGQAREFQSYMAPIAIEGRNYWVTGVRDEVGADFRYIQVPLDDKGSPAAFMKLRSVMRSEADRERIASALARDRVTADSGADTQDILKSAIRTIVDVFARGGFPALEQMVEQRVPKEQRASIMDAHVRILMAYTWQARVESAAALGLPAPVWSDDEARFMSDALQTMSDWSSMRLPGLAQLSGFVEVKASGLQLTRSPGKTLVYIGSLLLVLGSLIMFYVRERRVWVWLTEGEALLAMSANRRSEAFETEFEHLRYHFPRWLEEDLNERTV